jgi:excisionase family DNA binding protein
MMHKFAVSLPGLPSSPAAVLLPGEEVMKDDAAEIFTLDEVAAYLKVGKRTVYRLAAAKKIPAFKVGGTWRFRRQEIDQWINRQTAEAQGDDGAGGPHGRNG